MSIPKINSFSFKMRGKTEKKRIIDIAFIQKKFALTNRQVRVKIKYVKIWKEA